MLDIILQLKKQNPVVVLTAVAVLMVGLVYAVGSILFSPRHGVVSLTHITLDGKVEALEMQLEDLATSSIRTPSGINASTLIAAVRSPDLLHKALLYRDKNGGRSIAIMSGTHFEKINLPKGIPDVPQWSKDGTSIAFSEISSTSSAAINNPDNWIVVRAVPAGDALIVGHGYRPYSSVGQRTFALTSRGIELLSYRDQGTQVVVQSPTPVMTTTPFAVSENAMRIAWVAPADQSLQIFENVNGYFVPLLLQKNVHPQSIIFSPDGKYVLGAEQTGTSTALYVVSVQGGSVTHISDMKGGVKLNSWRYDK